MEKFLVLASNPWSFVDKETGEKKEGVTIEYIDANHPINEPSGKKGCFSLKETLSLDLLSSLVQVPAFYTVEYGMKPDKNRKPTMYIKNLVFDSHVEFKASKVS